MTKLTIPVKAVNTSKPPHAINCQRAKQASVKKEIYDYNNIAPNDYGNSTVSTWQTK